ncbi:MAG TPA: PP2C family protein-serine/threonine phosphatase, partial [Solirubrobacteraceae bacterium]
GAPAPRVAPPTRTTKRGEPARHRSAGRPAARRPRTDRRAPSAGGRAAPPPAAGAAQRDRRSPPSVRRRARSPHTASPRPRGTVDDVAVAINGIVRGLPDWSRPIIGILLLLVAGFGLRAFVSGRRARRLEAARRSLSADLAVLQEALVPSLPDRIGGVELSVAYRAADGLASGGDFYDVFALDDDRTGIILGDVSGHDREAIARAAAVRHKLRAYLELGFEPRAVLHAAGEALASDSFDGEFATAAVAVHDRRDGTLTYACAGHPPPILSGSAAHDPVVVCSSAPLGWGLPTGRRQTTVVLGDGDLACFFTDGLVEARVNGALLEREGLERLVDELGETGTATDLVDAVLDVARHAGDDLAALVIRTPASAATSAVRIEEVELDADEVTRQAPVRFLAACDASAALIEQTARAVPGEAGRVLLRVSIDPATGAVEAMPAPVPGSAVEPATSRV